MVSKRVLAVFAAFLLILSLVNFSSAISGKIGDARMVLYPKIGLFGTTIERTILVKNENDVPLNISLKPDENFSKIAKVIDSEFILQPGENKKARFEIKIKEEGDYEGRIFVYFTPIEAGNTGVALASVIIIHARRDSGTDSGDPLPNEYTSDSGAISNNSNTGTDSLGSWKDKTSPIVIGVLIITLILAGVLIWLMLLLNNNNNNKYKKRKRSDRSS